MRIFELNATIEQELKPTICLMTGKKLFPDLALQITFENVFKECFDDWHNWPEGDVKIIKIINVESELEQEFNHMGIIAKIHIRRACFNHLRDNNLLLYPNVSHFQADPYHGHNPFNEDTNHLAKIIKFPKSE